ncbi:complement C3-like [Haliotis rufescens]|uniref:complement C3-like n=1 Tax=Haliotis rufescens TaxID=6454 RepID=UPI00201F97D1|nr:complement C3-like [Haliotis rufescens]
MCSSCPSKMWGAKAFLVFCVLGHIGITRAFVGVIAPGKIRLGTNQKIFILGIGLNDNELEYRVKLNPGSPTHTFYSQTHTIENGVLTPIDIMVNPSDIVPDTSSEVTLMVLSTRRGGFNREVGIEIDRSPGYLFVQLDKPIYTSRQKVKYRVMAVDEDLRWAPWQVQVSLLNPRGHLIDRVTTNASEAFTGSEFPLSKNPMKGIWRLRASYTNVSTVSEATFEVKDYVLPRFGVRVKSNQTSMVWDNTSPLLLSIKAEYTYGKPTRGRVSTSLVARLLDLELPIMNNLQHQLNASGQVDVVLNDEELKDSEALRSLRDEVCSIYVKINVTEDGTNSVVREEYLVATLASYPYKLTVVNKKKYYQAGLPYTFEVEVTNIDESIAKNVPVVVVKMPGEETTTLTSNNRGRVSRTYIAPDSGDMVFRYQPEGHPLDESTLRVKRVTSSNSGYIVIEVEEKPSLNQDLPVHVRYHGSPGLYFIMVSSRGQVVFRESYTSGSNGDDVRTIPRRFLKDMVPSARIVVFYVASDHVVADSTHLLMKTACREELRIRRVGNKDSYLPKETGQISLSGGANMSIGLLAVDKAVYVLKFEKSLTRKKMFNDLDSHDFGSGSGSAANSWKIFEAAGFKLVYGNIRSNVPLFEHNLWTTARMSSRNSEDTVSPMEERILRSFFPESWLFEEAILDASGNLVRDVKYPDSITTWVMHAVGVSQDQGICVSNAIRVVVSQDFFLDVQLPFKAVKLEEVRVNVTVSSYIGYNTTVTLTATADGICMLDCDGDELTIPPFSVPNGGKRTESFSILPVNPGTYVIRVAAVTASRVKQDIVERHLVVVSEGEPNKKTINFNLDPNGKPRNDLTVTQSVNRRVQETRIHMAFPDEAIPESENIHITASGDLLGDVISNIVIGSTFPSMFDSADSLMMELAPSCYGLQYLSRLNSLTPEVLNKGRLHIRYGVAELLKYRTSDGAFCLEEIDEDYTPEPSVWFTTFVLKTLCSTRAVLNIDEHILEEGYEWLLNQVTGSQSRGFEIEDEDPRYIDGEEQQLLAEVLISSFSCSHRISEETVRQRDSFKQWWSRMRKSRLRNMTPLTLAKVTYARQNLNYLDSTWETAVRELKQKGTTNAAGYYFWSDEYHEAHEPIMYKTRPSSETIEATAYSLLVFVKVSLKLPCRTIQQQQRRRRRRGRVYRQCRNMYINPDKIADWLIQWRNGKGLFVGASDTAVATEALAAYRESKRIRETNLDVNVTASPSENFTHRMVFGEEDAFQPQSLQDVPLGQSLQVLTAGHGIGQMHVDASYNIPVDVDADCQFTMNVRRFYPDDESLRAGNTGVCSVCGPRLTCPKGDRFTCSIESGFGGISTPLTYCLNVCLKYNGNYNHGKTYIRVRMLTGYVPNECDLKELEGGRVVKAGYNDDYVEIQLRTVSAEEEECVGFRIWKIHDVFRIKPATVTLRSFNVDKWTCPRTYESGENVVSTPFYCPVQVNNQMRGCSCINDKCVDCGRRANPIMRLLRALARNSLYAFKLRALSMEEHPGYRHMLFNVEEDLKPCIGELAQQHVTFVTRQECGCPEFMEGDLFWVLGRDFNTYTDQQGRNSSKFFLNSNSYLLSSRQSSNFRTHSREITRAYRGSSERTCN